MNHQAIREQINVWLGAAKKVLLRSVDRSNELRRLLLAITSLAGSALMLSPILILALSVTTAAMVVRQSQDPLDWVIFGVLSACSALSGYLSAHLFLIRPSGASGVAIQRQEAPELFGMLERRTSHFKLAPVTSISLVADPKLTLQAVPKWPFPAGHKHTLIVGAPLLFFLSPLQFRLALAIAIADSARRQRGVSGWALQAAEDWPAIVRALKAPRSPLSKVLLKPAGWVADTTRALSNDFVCAAQQTEIRLVLEATEEQTAKEYLANTAVAQSFMPNQFWPMINQAAERYPSPPIGPFSQFEKLLERTLEPQTAQRWLNQAQTRRYTDQQGLRDLLTDLRLEPLLWSETPKHKAFQEIFASDEILQRMDTHWEKLTEAEWSNRYASFQVDRERFERLRERAGEQPLRGTAAISYIQLAARLLDREQAIAIYQEMYRVNRDSAAVCFASGREMLAVGHLSEGCEALQRASELDRSLESRAHALIHAHEHDGIGQPDPAPAPSLLATLPLHRRSKSEHDLIPEPVPGFK